MPVLEAAPPLPADAAAKKEFHFFAFMSDPAYDTEQVALWMVLAVAMAGLLYAGWLVGQVIGADEGTPRMREVGAAIRQGANAYLARQFRAIILLVFVLTGLIWATTEGTEQVPIGRAAAFFAGGGVLLAGRLRRHDAWRCGATSGSPPRRGPVTAGRCNWATAPARSPACSPTAWACWAARSSS